MKGQEILLLGLIILLIFVFMCNYSGLKDSYRYPRYHKLEYGTSYPNQCEFNEECLWDTGRTITLRDGTEGVCTLHGKACPSFSKDHFRDQLMGMNPALIGELYQKGYMM